MDNPWNFSAQWGTLPDQGPGPVPAGPGFDPNAPFTDTPLPVGLTPETVAGHLASQGITPQQFVSAPGVATRNPVAPLTSETPPPLGESLSPTPMSRNPTPVSRNPTPIAAPVPNFGSGPGAMAPTVENGVGSQQPRGIRNNNPLNIEAGAFTASQPGYKGSDGRFAQFDTPEQGRAAANALLDTYQNKFGLNTVNGIVGKWAPSADGNDVKAYASYVAGKLGIDPNAPIPADKRNALIDAMSEYENGKGAGGGGPGAAPLTAKAGSSPAPTSPNEPTSAFGKRLQEALAGVRAPAAPQPQKLYSPSVPHATGNIKSGQLAALLASLIPQQATRPINLASLISGR